MEIVLNSKQFKMVQHCLGLNKEPRHERNYFSLSEGCDGYDEWLDMVEKGYAIKYEVFGATAFSITKEFKDLLLCRF